MSEIWQFYLPGNSRAFAYLIPATVSQMPWTSDFRLDHSARTIRLLPQDSHSTSLEASSAAAMAKLLRAAQDADSFPHLSNWPGEKFPVLGSPFLFGIDRAIAPYFGIVTTGAQLTVFVRDEHGSVAGVWIPRRGINKPMYGGMLDNAVGGAVEQGETPFQSLVREAKEELGIDARSAVSGGTISWINVKGARSGVAEGVVEPGVQYVYDLEVDAKAVLRPAESGIEWLRLLSVEEVKAALFQHEFKPSCACVMIDFLVRHGMINAENESDLAEIVSRLHRRLPLPTTYSQEVA